MKEHPLSKKGGMIEKARERERARERDWNDEDLAMSTNGFADQFKKLEFFDMQIHRAQVPMVDNKINK
jgi:hypothetical protein